MHTVCNKSIDIQLIVNVKIDTFGSIIIRTISLKSDINLSPMSTITLNPMHEHG